MKYLKLPRKIAAIFFGATVITIADVHDSSAQVTQEYRGRACIVLTNVHCDAVGWSVGDCATARFLPPNVHGFGNQTSFSLQWTNYAQNFRVDDDAIGAVFKDAQFTWIGRAGGVADQSNSKLRVLLVQPSNYAAQWLHALIGITGYDDFGPDSRSQCYVRFRFTGQKYPDQPPAPAASPVAASGFGNASLKIGTGSD